MVSAINAFNNTYFAASRINAENNMLSNANDIKQNVVAASRQTIPFGVAYQKEQKLVANNLQNSLLYKIALAQEAAQKEKNKKKINYLA